jgi:hypothetical protein
LAFCGHVFFKHVPGRPTLVFVFTNFVRKFVKSKRLGSRSLKADDALTVSCVQGVRGRDVVGAFGTKRFVHYIISVVKS